MSTAFCSYQNSISLRFSKLSRITYSCTFAPSPVPSSPSFFASFRPHKVKQLLYLHARDEALLPNRFLHSYRQHLWECSFIKHSTASEEWLHFPLTRVESQNSRVQVHISLFLYPLPAARLSWFTIETGQWYQTVLKQNKTYPWSQTTQSSGAWTWSLL